METRAKHAVGYVGTAVAAAALGWGMQPAPTETRVEVPVERVVFRDRPVTVETEGLKVETVRTVYVERDARPQPNQCVMTEWGR